MVSLYLIFYTCLKLWFPDVETNPGLRHPVPEACRILCSNVWGLSKNLSNVTVALSVYDLLLCSETMVSDRRDMSELLVPGYSCPVLCRDGVLRLHMCEMVMGHFANLNLSMRFWYSGCVVLDRTSMCSVCIATLT